MLKRSRPRARTSAVTWKRHVVAGIVADFSGIEIRVFVEIAARHRALDWQPSGAIVGKKSLFAMGR
jgi:hypothetical protein